MSDYLWDKTGEPEEDVKQLENLLGALRYQPRPLEIPATAMPTPRVQRTTFFSRPRLAIAASLILMLLAGTWLVTRQDEPRIRLAKVEQGSPTPEGKQPQTAVVVQPETDKDIAVNKADQPKPREDKYVIIHTVAPKRQRPSRQFVATRQKRQPRRNENSPTPQHEEVAVNLAPTGLQFDQPLTPQQREATEQLILALRLTSAKLNYAQREMQEIGRAGK